MLTIILFILLSTLKVESYYIQLINQNKEEASPLNIAEIELYNNHVRIPHHFLTYSQSTTYGNFDVVNCFDQRLNTFCSTDDEDLEPHININTHAHIFDKVVIYNRLDCCRQRIMNATISIYDNQLNILWSSSFPDDSHQYVFLIDPELVSIDSKKNITGHSLPLLSSYKTHAQHGQDDWFLHYFAYKRKGVFVDIGANNGITFSNTYVAEQSFGWSGLLIEPQPELLQSLQTNRNVNITKIENVCAYNSTELKLFLQLKNSEQFHERQGFELDMMSGVAETWRWDEDADRNSYQKIEVPCRHIQELLDSSGISDIDFMSIDTEGAELTILKAIDWKRVKIEVIHAEVADRDTERELISYMTPLGYSSTRLVLDLCFYKNHKDVLHTHTIDIISY